MKRAKQRDPRGRRCQPAFVVVMHSDWSYDLLGKYSEKPVVMKPQVQTEGVRMVPDVGSIGDIAAAKNVIDIRQEYRRQLADWFANECINPFMEKCKAAGMSDDEAVAALNANLFRETRGLHGF